MSQPRSLLGPALTLTLTLSGLLIAAPGSAQGGTVITVKVTGTPASGFTGTFSATFRYDQGHTGTNGTFNFNGSGDTHSITYAAGIVGGVPALTGNGSGSTAESFIITTFGNSGQEFKLVAHAPSTRAVTIVLPTTAVIFASPTTVSLPNCSSFPSPPLAGSTFTQVEGGVTKYSGTITKITCSP